MSPYVQSYLDACDHAMGEVAAQELWLSGFLSRFKASIEDIPSEKSEGNRNFITGEFKEAFNELMPTRGFCGPAKDGPRFFSEDWVSAYIDLPRVEVELPMLARKRIDYVLMTDQPPDRAHYALIEFKNTLNFDAIASAAVEMALIRKFLHPDLNTKPARVVYWVVGMFEGQSRHELGRLNEALGAPIDKIWCFRTQDQPLSADSYAQRFDLGAIRDFRAQLDAFATAARGDAALLSLRP